MKVTNREKQQNKELVKEYPFLLPHNWMTGRVPDAYDYEYTELDMIPIGWRKAFGLQMIQDLKELLIKADFLEEYQVQDIKEKYGTIRWYDNFHAPEFDDLYDEWINKYEDLSEITCIECGEPAILRTTGWISPYCGRCILKYPNEKYELIEKKG